MRACRGCGLSIAETAPFCAVCGTRAEVEDAAPPPAPPASRTRRCALCGYPEPVAEIASFHVCGPCRGEVELLPLAPGDVRAFLAFAVERIMPATAETLEDFRAAGCA